MFNAGVAQLVEQRFRKARAAGSTPVAGFFSLKGARSIDLASFQKWTSR